MAITSAISEKSIYRAITSALHMAITSAIIGKSLKIDIIKLFRHIFSNTN